MAKRVAVLGWREIQTLVALCSRTTSPMSAAYDSVEQARRRLIDSFQIYLQEWLPGREIDDSSRIILIAALEEYAEATLVLDESMVGQEPISATQTVDECRRITEMLRSAMQEDPPSGSGIACALIAILICRGLAVANGILAVTYLS